MATGKFEEALTRLDDIVRALEKGDLSLEESLKRFEEGVKLSKNCLKMLEEAERKVDILTADKAGNKRLRPFSERRAERDRVANGPNKEDNEDEEEDEDDEELLEDDEESDESGDEHEDEVEDAR